MPDQSTFQRAEALMTLTPRQRRFSRRPGSLLFFGMPLMGLGLWLMTAAAFHVIVLAPVHVLMSVGATLVLVGFVLMVTRLRRVSQAAQPALELALAGGNRLRPGASAALRVRYRGPARIDRLSVTLVCERRYSRQVMTPGSTAFTSADEAEVVWSESLLDEKDIRLNWGSRLEKVVTLTVPGLAKPTGPVLPSGAIWWRLDVTTDTGRGAPLLDQFNIVVVLTGDAAALDRPAEKGPSENALDAKTVSEGLSENLGCGLITLAFLLVGPIFLYFYFSGTPTKRGNPVMALLAGLVFTGVGLLAFVSLITQFLKERRDRRANLGAGEQRPRER